MRYQDGNGDVTFAGDTFRHYNFVTKNTIDINMVTFDRLYDYVACMTLSWCRACARRVWVPAASGGKFGR